MSEPTTDEDLAASWAAGLDELAPSTDGVSVSDEPKAEAEPTEPTEPKQEAAPAAEATAQPAATGAAPAPAPVEQPKPRNLGGLSTDELLELVRNEPTNPDTLRALQIRLKRQDAQAGNNRKRDQHGQALATQASQIKQAITGLETEYPEIAKSLQPISEFAESAARPFIEQERQASIEAGKALIESAFPNFIEVSSSNEFLSWLQTQPQRVHELVAHGGPSGAIDVLSWFEQHVKQSGKTSPFEPQQVAPPSPPPIAAESAEAKAARVAEERRARLQQSTPIPSSARTASQTSDENDPTNAWRMGLRDVEQMERHYR